jgi:macrolide transport system ATP-binding/permease protein
MTGLRESLWRMHAMLRRDRLTADMTEELQLHVDLEIEAGLRRGLSLDEAKRQARLRAGLVSEGIELMREAHGVRWMDGAAGDLRHAFRSLTRNRAFGTVAVLVLAASVAINTLLFFMLDGVVLRPLPYASPERLVRLYDVGKTAPKFAMAVARFLDYRADAPSLEAIALYTGQDMELSATDGRSRQLSGLAITTDYFNVLGRPPVLGRAFRDTDLHGDTQEAVISYRLWQDHFQGDPAIIGKTIRINRKPVTVIGVAPEGFQHVGGDYRSPIQGETVDIWVPLSVSNAEMPMRAYHFCNAIARIRSGVSETQARQELDRLAALYSKRYPRFGDWGVRMEPLLNEVTGRSRQVIWLLMAAGGLVLLVACANIAGLCVARAVARRKELALRYALGANRWQLVRVGLAENLLIGVAGAILGLLLAGAGLPLLRQLLPADFPRAHEIGLTASAAFFATAVALATVLLAGLLPAGRNTTLESQQRVTAGRESRRLRSALVVGEIALAGLLCAGAFFLLRSYREIGARDHGFNPESALTFQLTIPNGGRTPTDDHVARLYETIRTNIEAIPGVASAGASTNLPWSGYDENTAFAIVGRTVSDTSKWLDARYQAASPGYFEATGMRLVSGRFFDRHRDILGQPFTVVVNDALVSRYFPKGDAIGTTIDVFGQKRQIVGVVGGIRDSPADLEVKPALWFPLGQVEFDNVFFAVRSTGVDPTTLTSSITAAVHAADPELPLANIRTLERRAAAALGSRRFALWLFQAFAVLALILAAAGIYGLLAYVVRQRRKELSIRAALGASRADLWTMVLADGLKMAGAGTIGCLLLIPLGGSLLQSFLYNVKAFDPFTVVGAPLALLAVSVLASLGPARSATRSDPSLALRED